MKFNLKHLRLAASFLTMLPLAPREIASDEDWAEVIKYFPWVGFIYALLNASLLLFFRFYPGISSKPILFAFILVFTNLLVSGGLHLDGLADSADGIAASKGNHAETRTVMRDSRVGAFGAIAVATLVVAKVACLAEVDLMTDFYGLMAMLILVPIVVRSSVVVVMCKQTMDNSEHTSKVSALMGGFDKKLAMQEVWKTRTLALLISSLIAMFATKFGVFEFIEAGFSLIIFVFLLSFLSYQVNLYLARKLYGHSGDSLGAGMEVTEAIGFLLVALS